MSKLLHIDSSILSSNSVSRQLTAQIVASWRAAHPAAEVSYLDLAVQTPGHFSADAMGFRLPPSSAQLTDAQKRENALSEALVSQFLASDVVVIGAPLYNFPSPPSSRPGLTALPRSAALSPIPTKALSAWPAARR